MLRFAPGLAAAVSAVALADGAWRHRTPHRVLAHWSSTAATVGSHPARLITSIFLTSGPRMSAGICLAFVGVAFAEHRLGWRRALRCGLVGTIVATLVCDVVLLVAARAGVHAAQVAAHTLDFGASAVTAGALGGAALTLRGIGRVLLALAVLNGLLITHGLADFEHLVAFAVGAVLP